MPEDKKHDQEPGAKAEKRRADSAETETFAHVESQMSDVVLAASLTGAAPSYPAPGPTELQPTAEKRVSRDKAPPALLPGARVDDFEVVRLLGRGAFGHVYLARQLSLDRLVALKVSANRGSEGRTMARLEHQHIVQVFSEKIDAESNQRLLCMQLVPGVGLEKLIAALHPKQKIEVQGTGQDDPFDRRRLLDAPANNWTGEELLAIIDRSTSLPATLDPSALHDREALARMDAVEATAWFGARLAEALDFAHGHGVLHRDIKPANILVNSYGRPLLADFNISSQPLGSEPSGDEMFGGTFAYMAPEHLDAFNPRHPTSADAVTAQSDLFSLGLVLEQMLAGRLHFPLPSRELPIVDILRKMSDERRRQRPAVGVGPPGARKTLERTIAGCLEPEPADRFANGAALAEQLDGCRRLRQAERQLPPLPAMLSPVSRHPFVWLIILIVLPQLAGSAVNILYNATQIVGKLTESQQALFAQLVVGYNAIAYPVAVVTLVLIVRPVLRCWKALQGTEPMTDGDVAEARRKALRLPRWIAGLNVLGWFPGGFLFPSVIAVMQPPLGPRIFAHFIASFCLSGLIALAYSLCGAQYIVLRMLYPGMWRNVRDFSSTANEELFPIRRRLGWIQVLAVSIPLVAVVMLVFGGSTGDLTFKLLVTALIFLGILGLFVTSAVTRRLSEVIAALTSTKA